MTVSYTTLFTLWLAVTCAPAIAVGLYYAGRDDRARPPRRRPKLYRCEACALVYEDPRNVPLSPCPRCGALNEAARR